MMVSFSFDLRNGHNFYDSELGIPDHDDAGSRWAVDHLFLDQDGIPTLIEVKRSTDTRIRREVVGQMLDYAANAVLYWSVDSIRLEFENQCEIDPHEKLCETFQFDLEYAEYWQLVKTNLQAGKIRLLFIADDIPNELKRIIEFLNEQMDPAEVLGLEIKQFVGSDLKTLVPRVIGQTSKANSRKKVTSESRPWNREKFINNLEKRHGKKHSEIAEKILQWATDRDLTIWWGKGKQDGSFFPILDIGDEEHFTFSVWTYGRIEIQFQHMQNRPVFDDIEKRRLLLKKLNKVPKIQIPENKLAQRPSFQLDVLSKEENLQKFLKVWDDYITELKKNL